MSQFFRIHPLNPQPRLIIQAAKIIQDGGVVIYPTDSAYAIGCQLADKEALQRIRMIRKLDENHNFTLICRDLSEVAEYAIVDNSTFRTLKAHTPGPYTFILKASKEVPRRLLHPKRSTIGLRIPDNKIVLALLEELNQPLMSVSFVEPGQEYPLIDSHEIYEKFGKQVDLVIDGGHCGLTPTTIVDLHDGGPKIVRAGKGELTDFE